MEVIIFQIFFTTRTIFLTLGNIPRTLPSESWFPVYPCVPCIRLALLKFELTDQNSAGGKNLTVLTSKQVDRTGIETGQLFWLEMEINIHEKGFTIPKPCQIVKSEKHETFCVSKLLIWRQKWVAGVGNGNSLVVRRVSPGRIIVFLFWTKYAVPRQNVKPEILKLTIRRSQRNFSIVFMDFMLAAKKKAIIESFR